MIQNLGRVGDELEQRELLVRKREAEVTALRKQVRGWVLKTAQGSQVKCPCRTQKNSFENMPLLGPVFTAVFLVSGKLNRTERPCQYSVFRGDIGC